MKKLVSLLLSSALALSACIAAYASPVITYSGGSASSSVTLNLEPYSGGEGTTTRRFSVTVPTSLPLWVLSDNTTISASDVQIYNNSSDDVKVTSVKLNTYGKFKLVDYDSNFTILDTNSYKFGMAINDDTFNANTKTLSMNADNWKKITKSSTLPLSYTARFAPVTEAIKDLEIAEVIFTVAFAD